MARVTIRLRLIGIEMRTLLEVYEKASRRESEYQQEVKLAARDGNRRAAEFRQRLDDAREAMKETEQRLVKLEVERGKLLRRLGKKDADDTPVLSALLERLTAIEKRLEKLERRR